MDVGVLWWCVGHGFWFAVWRKPALRIPTFDARRCSAMEREPDDVFAERACSAKKRDGSVQRKACSAKRAAALEIGAGAGSRREDAALNLRLRQPFFKINRG